ncbi:9-O-acetylesterase [Neiella marina]|uniref:9-O-acetylesterase n=1 Tax=Neiella marina TaxID=508461 RepID=A0A8J2XN08_9GAMM|nr:sialate O-acetylesterase [Neiella marina]GGA64727.1 9-O-acetylesterase [Neiella marina]
MLVRTLLLVALMGLSGAISAAPFSSSSLEVSSLVSSHMVLQRHVANPISGKAPAGTELVVSFADIQLTTQANAEGLWQVELPPMSAGGPYTLAIRGEVMVSFDDIYIGDVWVASGQSNMEWKVGNDINNMAAEIADSNYPLIRFAEVAKAFSPSPFDQLQQPLRWRVASTNTVADFSAVAWFFAKHAQRHENVAVGIIDSTWGGTPAEAWTPVAQLLSLPRYEALARDVMANPQQWRQRIASNQQLEAQKWQLIEQVDDDLAKGVHLPEFDDRQWLRIALPNTEPLTDIVWLRKSFNLELLNQPVVLELGSVVQNAHVFLNGQLIHTKNWSSSLERLALDPAALRVGQNVLALRISNDWDNKVYVGKTDQLRLHVGDNSFDFTQEWAYNNQISPPLPAVERIHWNPSMLFNAMIKPLTQQPIKGVIWYQGENNVGEAGYYQALFAELIQGWRNAWRQPELPFVFTQLANYLPPNPLPVESQWAQLREAQRQTLALDKTAMAVTIDIGEADDIHPRNKQDVGYRLWLGANALVYRHPPIIASPAPSKVQQLDKQLVIGFNFANQGLKLSHGEKLTGFAIKPRGSSWQWQDGKIRGSQVVLPLPSEVKSVEAVRYGWADNPAANLINGAGLPATPFEMTLAD